MGSRVGNAWQQLPFETSRSPSQGPAAPFFGLGRKPKGRFPGWVPVTPTLFDTTESPESLGPYVSNRMKVLGVGSLLSMGPPDRLRSARWLACQSHPSIGIGQLQL